MDLGNSVLDMYHLLNKYKIVSYRNLTNSPGVEYYQGMLWLEPL